MQIERKSAAVTAPADDEFPGTFEVILSNAEQDRDGESLSQDTWKSLPDHIPFDIDHEMSVRGTVGSGKPSFDASGNLVVKGTFSSLPIAQEVRTLIKEGHITKTSVAFARDKSGVKDGRPEMRELLNGAFVAIPSNRSADILLAKSFTPDDGLKIGATISAINAKHIQAIHDHAAALGAKHGTEPAPDDGSGEDPHVPAKSFGRKDADTSDATDAGNLASATDAAIDQAIDLLDGIDTSKLDPKVAQAIALIHTADAAVDKLLAVMGVPDPDADASKSAAADTKSAAADVSADAIATRALAIVAAGFTY